jgi:hypothetical protein
MLQEFVQRSSPKEPGGGVTGLATKPEVRPLPCGTGETLAGPVVALGQEGVRRERLTWSLFGTLLRVERRRCET